MKNLNKVLMTAYVWRDPDLINTRSGRNMLKIPIVVKDSYKDKNTEQWIEQSDWFTVIVFGEKSIYLKEVIKKGYIVFVEGKLKSNKYEKDGETRYSYNIVADHVSVIKQNEKQESKPKQGGEPTYEPHDNQDDLPF